MCMRCRIREAIFHGALGVRPVEAIVALREMEQELKEAVPPDIWAAMVKDAETVIAQHEAEAKLQVN